MIKTRKVSVFLLVVLELMEVMLLILLFGVGVGVGIGVGVGCAWPRFGLDSHINHRLLHSPREKRPTSFCHHLLT